jgi:WD40 repeat protein
LGTCGGSLLAGMLLLGLMFVAPTSLGAEEPKKEQPAGEDKAKKITYEEHIKPIFRENCFFCHGQDEKENDLALHTYGSVMQGGASGASIEPGDPDSSRLWLLVNHTEQPNMPPESDKLPEAQLALIKKWIELGALENANSKAKLPKKPMADLSAIGGAGGEGQAVLPEGLSRQPEIYTPRAAAVSAIAASPFAPLVAVAGQKQIVFYHTETAEMLGVLPYPEGVAHVLKFSRNGALLLAGGGQGSHSGTVVVFDVKTGNRVFEVGSESDVVLAADINENHTQIALGGPKRVVRVYSTATGELQHEIRKHTDWINALEFSPDGVLLATADRSGGMFVWEAETAREYATLKGHTDSITDVSWRIDSNVLASSSEDATVRLWEMNNGTQIKSFGAHGGGASSVEFARNGNLVSTGSDRTAKVWDGNGTAIVALPAFADLALEVAITHDSKRVVAGDWTGEVRLFEIEGAKQLALLPSNPPTLQMVAKDAAQQAEAAAANAAKLAAEQTAAQQAATAQAAEMKQSADALAAVAAAMATLDGEVKQLTEQSGKQAEAVKQAQAQLAVAQKALADAQARDVATKQLLAEKTVAARKTVEEIAAAKAVAEKVTAAKQAADKLLAEKLAAAQAAAAEAAKAQEAAAKAAEELNALLQTQKVQAPPSQDDSAQANAGK